MAETGLIGTARSEAFDRLVELAARLTHAPVAFFTLVDEERSWYHSSVGVPDDVDSGSVEASFCKYVIGSDREVAVGDRRHRRHHRRRGGVPRLPPAGGAGPGGGRPGPARARRGPRPRARAHRPHAPHAAARALPSEGGPPLVESGRTLMLGIPGRASTPAPTICGSPGDILAVFTDGLFERPGRDIDDGLAHIMAVLDGHRGAAPPMRWRMR